MLINYKYKESRGFCSPLEVLNLILRELFRIWFNFVSSYFKTIRKMKEGGGILPVILAFSYLSYRFLLLFYEFLIDSSFFCLKEITFDFPMGMGEMQEFSILLAPQ